MQNSTDNVAADSASGALGGGLSLEKVLATLRRRAGVIVACMVLTGLLAVGLSILQTKQYTSTASLLFRDNGAASSVFGGETITLSGADAAREAATNVELVSLQVVSERTAEELGGTTTADDVAAAVKIEAQGQSDVVLVQATDHEPARAQDIANTFAEQFIQFRATADRSRLMKAKRLADREFMSLSPEAMAGPRGEQLSRGAERLGILASLQTGNAELVQPAEEPSSPSSPKPLRNGVIGAFFGLLFGIGLAFLLERLNRRIREPDEAQEVFELPLLGVIPESKAIADPALPQSMTPLPFAEEESFRMLRASLRYFSVDHEIRTLLITSSTAQAGKSTVAWNLARVAAKTAKVVLLETDLRNPSLAQNHESLQGSGLAQVLTHQCSLDEAIHEVPLGNEGIVENGGGPATLSVVTAGSVPPNPAELIESQGMADVLSQLAERFEFVVVDTAPIGVVSDAFPLMGKVDGVVIVARMEKATRDDAEDLRDQLRRLNAPALGVVANGLKLGRRGKYGYGYGYGYYGQRPDDSAEPAAETPPKQPTGAE